MEDKLFNQIKSNIDFVRKNVKKSELKWIELDELERATEKVTEYSNQCHQCSSIYQQNLLSYSEKLKNNVNSIEYGTKKFKSIYREECLPAINHLIKEHKCEARCSFLITYGIPAMLIDTVLYVVSYLGFINWTIPVVTIMGIAYGSFLDLKVKKDGRALYK